MSGVSHVSLLRHPGVNHASALPASSDMSFSALLEGDDGSFDPGQTRSFGETGVFGLQRRFDGKVVDPVPEAQSTSQVVSCGAQGMDASNRVVAKPDVATLQDQMVAPPMAKIISESPETHRLGRELPESAAIGSSHQWIFLTSDRIRIPRSDVIMETIESPKSGPYRVTRPDKAADVTLSRVEDVFNLVLHLSGTLADVTARLYVGSDDVRAQLLRRLKEVLEEFGMQPGELYLNGSSAVQTIFSDQGRK